MTGISTSLSSLRNTNFFLNKKIIVMCFETKAKALQRIKKKIHLPKDWFEKTEDKVLIKYLVDDRMLFLTIDRAKIAPILQQIGLISRYEGEWPNRKMYKSGVGKDGSLEWVQVEVSCNDLQIYETHAIHFIADYEYKKILEFINKRKQYAN